MAEVNSETKGHLFKEKIVIMTHSNIARKIYKEKKTH